MWVKAPEYIIPIDIGQASDFTAMGGLRRRPRSTGKERENYVGSNLEMVREYEDVFDCGYAHRFPLHTPYPVIVDSVKETVSRIPGTWRVVVDATGVGRPVVDMMQEAGLNPVGIIITGGAGNARQDPATGYWNVPKRELVSRTQTYMQSERLRISGKLPLSDVIVKEMLAFKMKISAASGHMSFEAWRDGAHDDLVLMLCMGIWWGHQTRSGWQKDRGPQTSFDESQRKAARERFAIDTNTPKFTWNE